jgi:hypothetical protein
MAAECIRLARVGARIAIIADRPMADIRRGWTFDRPRAYHRDYVRDLELHA